MPKLRANLIDRGVNIRNGYTSVPLCAPARVSLFTGKWVHNHGIEDNSTTHQLFRRFNLEDDTVATRLKAQGCATGYFGKYMNGYGDGPEGETYVAPGWGRWFILVLRPNERDFYTVNSDGTLRDFSRAEWNETDLLADRAADFIRSRNGRPWLCYMGIHSPHGPYYPAPRHAYDFDGVKLSRPPSYAEENVSDKPQVIQRRTWTDEDRSTDATAKEMGSI